MLACSPIEAIHIIFFDDFYRWQRRVHTLVWYSNNFFKLPKAISMLLICTSTVVSLNFRILYLWYSILVLFSIWLYPHIFAFPAVFCFIIYLVIFECKTSLKTSLIYTAWSLTSCRLFVLQSQTVRYTQIPSLVNHIAKCIFYFWAELILWTFLDFQHRLQSLWVSESLVLAVFD